MRTDKARKQALKVASQQNQENSQVCKVLQDSANQKNLVGRTKFIEKDIKLAHTNTRSPFKIIQETANKENVVNKSKVIEKEIKLTTSTTSSDKELCDKSVQAEAYEYWKSLAEERGKQLEENLMEQEHLKDNIEALQEENRICKEMLDEARVLVEVLQEMIPNDAA